MTVNILGNIEVEAWIIYKNQGIGIPSEHIALAHLHVLRDSAQVQQHRDEPHIGKVAIMTHACAAHSRHQVAAKEAEIGIRVTIAERLHQMGCMQVATCFAYDNIVFHGLGV